jgi:hypothetical protein
MEATMMRSYMRGANLRRWLRRPNCLEVVRQFKNLFDKAFSSGTANSSTNEPGPQSPLPDREQAHHSCNGVIFSRSSTHLGNSLVLYYPTLSSVDPIAGSIQSIQCSGSQVYFYIKRQAPLPLTKYDPFCRYPSFPAKLYSSKMVDGPDDVVPVESAVSHVARFELSSERAVILNLSRVCS